MQTDYGPYRILRQIATGGMAEIYLARQSQQEGVGRKVILKKILSQRAKDDEFVTMFLDEARLMSVLSHPNIAQVFDFGKIDGSYYLVMEYVHGSTLGVLLDKVHQLSSRGLPDREAVGIAMAIAEALTYLHGLSDEHGRPLNIVHRDLNPSNIMVGYDGSVKLIDFGIAKSAARVYETRTGVVKGTYGYIAPEQFTSGALVDHRADVFALGVILYEMCLGSHPFHAGAENLMLERIFAANYKRPRQVNPNFPKTLERIIVECLTPHPEGRPRDTEQLIRRLCDHILQQGTVPTMVDLGRYVKSTVVDDDEPTRIPSIRIASYVSSLQQLPSIESRSDFQSGPPPLPSASLPPSGAGASALTDSHRTFSDSPTVAKTIGDIEGESTFRKAKPLGSVAPPRRAVAIRDVSSAMRFWKRRTSALEGPPSKTGLGTWMIAIALFGAVGGGILYFRHPSETVSMSVAPEAPAQPSETNTLSVQTTPDGATVYVNNQAITGVTPINIQVPSGVGRVWIRVVKKGYLSEEREVIASSGEARFVLSEEPSH